MATNVTIPDLWEAFLQAEDKLILKVQTYEACSQLKRNLSTYKNRILRKDTELAGVLGKFTFDYEITEIQEEGKDRGKWIMSIGMKRSRAKPRMEVEIL